MKKNKIALLLSLCSLFLAQEGFAEEQGEDVVQVAAWLEPEEAVLPDWISRENAVTWTQSDMQVVAANASYAIVKRGTDYVLTDDALHMLGTLVLPENVAWIGMDDQNRVFAYDGAQLFYADAIAKVLDAEGFQPAVQLGKVLQIDHLGALFVYADAQNLVFSDLDTLQTTQIALHDFFDDGRVAQMTPEAVENASKKKKKSSKSKTALPASQPLPDVEVQALAIRHDGVVVLKVHRLLQTRVFVSKDRGRSWTQMTDAPNTIVRQLGWIWDGQNRVLSSDATAWVEVCGEPLDMFRRFLPTNRPVSMPELHLSGTWPQSPSLDPVSVPGDVGQSVSESGKVPDESGQTSSDTEKTVEGEKSVSGVADAGSSVQTCVHVDAVPRFSMAAQQETAQPASYLSPRSYPRSGTRYYFTNEGTPDMPVGPVLWRHASASEAPERLDLPDACDPLFVDGSQGLGVLLCRQGEDASQIYVYVRTETTGWYAEATIPQGIGIQTRMSMAADGTLVLAGDCETVTLPAKDAVFDEAGNVLEEAVEASTQVLCSAAVRDNVAVGVPDAWRIERVRDALDFQPYGAGRVLALTKNDDQTDRLVLLSKSSIDTAVESFDASPYDGVEMTPDGCFALYEANVPQEGARLLTPDGKLSQVDCTTAKELTLARREAAMLEADWEVGDNRFGMRLGAGAFIASGIQTWFMRVEGLFPIYGGKYEVGAIFRMAGGNEGASMGYMGLIAARWRYDDFEKFDFAVGAGVGYGQLTGYVQKMEENAEGEMVETEKSATYYKAHKATLRYMISGMAAYRLSAQWKLYLNAELLGGSSWGLDIGAGIEIRF